MFEKLFGEHSFDIHCPNCDEKNKIKLSQEIKCKKCETSFSEKIFFGKISCSTISKLLIGASLGIGGTLYTELKWLENLTPPVEKQIPIPVEKAYKLVQSCIKYNSINYDYYTKKIRDNCFCAVEKLSEDQSIRFSNISSYTLQSYYETCSSQ